MDSATDPDAFAGPSGHELPNPEQTGPEELWSYSGKTGPEHWADLDPAFRECAIGKAQSPIDLTDPVDGEIGEFQTHYRAAPGVESNNGHEIEVALRHAGGVRKNGVGYALQQFHFHLPSEHAVDGDRYEAEMHLVHANADEELAVISALIDVGEENQVLAEALEDVPVAPGRERDLEGEIDASDLLPNGGSGRIYRYHGSLTTPPCTEGVVWTVFEDPIEISAQQFDNLAAAFDEDARPLQARNDRELIEAEAG